MTSLPDTDTDPMAKWAAAGVDPTRPNIARVYDYWLGGKRNLVADRELAERMATLDPWIPVSCRANRAFLGRAVRFLTEQGIRQFLDIGSGIPTSGNVHEVAQSLAPDARVVYVDRDPVAVAESRDLLAGNSRAVVVEADLRDLDTIVPRASELLDFSEPVAVMLVAVLHFLLDADQPHQLVASLRDATVPGSYLVVSHATSHGHQQLAEEAERVYNRRAADGQARTLEQITAFFGSWCLQEPGVTWVPLWRPGPDDDVPVNPELYWFMGGVGRH